MGLRAQVIGVNRFLTMGYGREARLSTVLASLGFTQQQIQAVRDEHLAHVIHAFVTSLRERVVAGSDGERLYTIMSRRLGLDGDPPSTLAALGRHLGISRERVRQLEQKALSRCRSRARRQVWEAALLDLACALVGPSGGGATFDSPTIGPASSSAHASKSLDPSRDLSDAEMRNVFDGIYIILRAVSAGLNYRIIAQILAGKHNPVVDGFVTLYQLPHHGCMSALNYRQVRRAVRVICITEPCFEMIHGWAKLKE